MAHIHAELMAQYAEDAKQHDKPWELWQHGDDDDGWTVCTTHPSWYEERTFRRKPRTICVGDIEVPEPVQEPLTYGQEYFVPDVTTGSPRRRTWAHDYNDTLALASNLIHLESCSAALHAKALIEVSKGWWK